MADRTGTGKRSMALGYMAKFESRSFTFEAFGHTEAEALKLLRAAFERHAEQYSEGRPERKREISDYFKKFKDDISVIPLVVGGYRDGEKIA